MVINELPVSLLRGGELFFIQFSSFKILQFPFLLAEVMSARGFPFENPIRTLLPDTLLESELFAYKAGAFTDDRKDKRGRIAMAEGGTHFLEEIGDISSALQIRLLRFLQDTAMNHWEAQNSNMQMPYRGRHQ